MVSKTDIYLTVKKIRCKMKEIDFLLTTINALTMYDVNQDKKECEHKWEKFCNKAGCVSEECEGHRGRLCTKCKIDKCDALIGENVGGKK